MAPERTEGTPSQAAWIERARGVLPGGVLGMTRETLETSVVASHGKGPKLYDLEGDEYLDCRLASGPLILGHCHPEVVAAVEKQIRRGSTFYVLNQPAIELAELIVSAVPCAEQLRYCASGAEATFHAIRMARTYTGRQKVLKFEGAYHGVYNDLMMSVAPTDPPRFPAAVPACDGIPESLADLTLVAPFNDAEMATRIIREQRDQLAAVIVEPFQRAISPKPGFLESLRAATAECGVVLIFDEVVTGFRFGWGGAQELYGVVPDMACLAKIIGGGYHQAAVCGCKDLMVTCDPTRRGSSRFAAQSGTLNGNPIACSAGLATLRVLQSGMPETYSRLFEYGRRARAMLKAAMDAHGVVAQVVGEGPIFGLHATSMEVVDYRSSRSGNKAREKAYVDSLLSNKVILGGGKGYLSLAHDEADFEWLGRAFDAAARAMADIP